MIKIFSSDKTIILTSDQSLFRPADHAILASVESEDEMRLLYDELLDKKLDEIWFYHHEILTLYTYFSAMFRVVRAAGGLVHNNKGEWLFIYRNGKWDLPKGKIEKNEDTQEAGVREVEEECGISGLSVIRELSPTYHIYTQDKQKILKPTYWFEMSCAGNPELKPQSEEGITDVQWIGASGLGQVRENTFASILEVLKATGK